MNKKTKYLIGELVIQHIPECDCYHVAELCPMNTSHPSADNAFWQQVSKQYRNRKTAEKQLEKMLKARQGGE